MFLRRFDMKGDRKDIENRKEIDNRKEREYNRNMTALP
jgi:hypothetical protein